VKRTSNNFVFTDAVTRMPTSPTHFTVDQHACQPPQHTSLLINMHHSQGSTSK